MTVSTDDDAMQPEARYPLRASIVITTYQRTAMLAELLDALNPQAAGLPVEVIVVDNCPDASARSLVNGYADQMLRYEHEPRSGVVHARNAGVRAAQGQYLIFLDDDEIPAAGWLDAWLMQADGYTDASFGRIVPRHLATCPEELTGQVERAFKRDFQRRSGSDITAYAAYLGTGNAMLHKARCLGGEEPFDQRFNARGGEDVWLIRQLVKDGRRLLWNHEAVVEELVPLDRMNLPSLAMRRFNQGQLRGVLAFGTGGVEGMAKVSIWMLVGLLQWLGNRSLAWLAGRLAPHLAPALLCRSMGGAGKLAWWREARTRGYGGGQSADLNGCATP